LLRLLCADGRCRKDGAACCTNRPDPSIRDLAQQEEAWLPAGNHCRHQERRLTADLLLQEAVIFRPSLIHCFQEGAGATLKLVISQNPLRIDSRLSHRLVEWAHGNVDRLFRFEHKEQAVFEFVDAAYHLPDIRRYVRGRIFKSSGLQF